MSDFHKTPDFSDFSFWGNLVRETILLFFSWDSFSGWWGASNNETAKLTIITVPNMGVSNNSGTPKWMVYHGKLY